MLNNNSICFTLNPVNKEGMECLEIKASRNGNEDGEVILNMAAIDIMITGVEFDNTSVIFIRNHANADYLKSFYHCFVAKEYGSVNTKFGKGHIVQINRIWNGESEYAS